MSNSVKKIAIIAFFYLISLISLTWIIVYLFPVKYIIDSLPVFYLVSVIFAFFISYYLFFSEVVDIKKEGKILVPDKRDITKRKVLLVTFIYSVFFTLMFIYEHVSLITFALWPVMVLISLLLLFDRRLIFSVKECKEQPQSAQKYGIRILMAGTVLSSMWFLNQFISRKTLPMQSGLLVGWEFVDISIWVFPIAFISSLVIADWVSTLIVHDDEKDFFKRSDVILFAGIAFLIAVFLFII